MFKPTATAAKTAATTGWAPGTVTHLSALSTWGVKRILNPFFLAMEAGSPAPENMRHKAELPEWTGTLCWEDSNSPDKTRGCIFLGEKLDHMTWPIGSWAEPCRIRSSCHYCSQHGLLLLGALLFYILWLSCYCLDTQDPPTKVHHSDPSPSRVSHAPKLSLHIDSQTDSF